VQALRGQKAVKPLYIRRRFRQPDQR
jgi:hypothetical protein